MTTVEQQIDLTPWKPTPTDIPEEWMRLVEILAQESKGLQHAYLLNVRYDSQSVGDLLRAWGLPWQVVVAGYLWEYDKERIRQANLSDADQALHHIDEAQLYARYIQEENLPPLLTPPYHDLGALLLAVAAYYRTLQLLQEQSNERPYTGKLLSYIESIGRTLRNIATRLGMWYLKRDVEDLVEHLRSPRKFVEAKQDHARILRQDASMLEDTQRFIFETYCEATHRPVIIECKPCGIAGMKRRQQDANTTATTYKEQLTGFDLVTFYVIVPTVRDCYTALGIFSQLGYIQDRVTDLIANPKANGCSSIAFGLIVKPQMSYAKELKWPETYTRISQIEIATSVMYAVTWYGCLYSRCYQLYTGESLGEDMPLPQLEQLWQSKEGKIFFTVQQDCVRTKPVSKTPIVVYDNNHNPTALPKGATALDFAYAADSSIGERAVEALVNNRKAPLYRTLDAGDIVEIRISNEIQAQDYWLQENYAKASVTRRHINESLNRRFLDRRGYHLLQQELERYHYMLSPEALDEELRLLVKQYNLGSPQVYLEKLNQSKEEFFSVKWAAQEIMQRISERNEYPSDSMGRPSWIPVLDMQLTASKKLFYRQRLCGFCQPIYPRDIKIMGRIRQHSGELIVHKESCPHLIDRSIGHRSALLPMTWQLQPPAFRVTFFIKAQDRSGLILDLTRELRRHQCDLLFINAEAVNKLGEARIRFTIEAHDYKEVLNIWRESSKIEGVVKVEIDAAATAVYVHDQLQRLHQQGETLSDQTPIELDWSIPMVIQEARPVVLSNPFDISRPASAKMFFGRLAETETMRRELCEGEQGKALILMGPRRSGKSSICKNFLERQVRAPFWGTLFSLQSAMRQNEETVLTQLAEKVGRDFHEQLNLPAPGWQDFSESDPLQRFRSFLEVCTNRVPGTRLVLALDEFGGAFASYEEGILDFRFFTYWKELMSDLPQLSLIIVLPTSSHQLLTSGKFVNVFSFAQHLSISFLDIESAKQLLVDPLREQSIEIHPSSVALALKLTGSNPYYMTLIGQQLIHYLNKEIQQQRISDIDLRLIVDQLIERGANQNFDFMRTELQGHKELRILEAIVELTSRTKQSKVQLKKIAAHANLSFAHARRNLDRLRVGLILDENGPLSNPYYSFKIELVRRWLIRNRWFFSPAAKE